MHFSDILGQDNVKLQLAQQLATGRVPHAQLFYGPKGSGKLPMALAFARSLLCRNRQGTAPCEGCNDCNMSNIYEHPDLHFVYPVFKRKGGDKPEHTDFVEEWHEELSQSVWFDQKDWFRRLGVENQQPMIYESQSESLISVLGLKAQKSEGYKVVIVWLPETMNLACANKLLKTLEEPMGKTAFLMVSEAMDMLLPTILSRVQRIKFAPLDMKVIADSLVARNGLVQDTAERIAHLAQGSYLKALRLLRLDAERELYLDMFVSLMRLAYMRDIRSLGKWSDEVASWGRERQKEFLRYAQGLIRENFIYNFSRPALNYETRKEEDFSKNFARFINERNVIGMAEEFALAERDVEGNVNPKMVFFDFCLKVIVLLVK